MKSTALRNAAGLTVIACLALLCQTPASASSASAATSYGDVIASGVITNAHGQVDRSGEVYVFAVPDQSELISQRAGETLPLTLVGYARTSAHGQYAVDARSASLMKTNGQYGYVNLQVIAVSGGKTAVADYSVMPAGAAWRVEGGSNSVPSLSFNFATRVATLPPVAAAVGVVASKIPITPAPLTAAFERVRKATDFASASMPATPNTPCGVAVVWTYRDRPEHFNTTETIGGNIPETIIEGTNSSTTHTLGVAFSASVKKVKWSADGTGSITDSSTHSVSITYSVPHTIYNRVNYHEYWYNCWNDLELRAYSFWDLLTNDGRQVSITWQWHCGHHPAGADWSTGSAKSATIGGGMSIGPVSVSAQAGFGSSVELDFHFNKAGEICGNSPDGPFSSSILEADQY
jgi:hypothetical protein